MRRTTKLPSQEELREHFEYRDGHLFWRHNTARRSAGDEVGVVDKKYRVGCLNYIRFLIHRAVWVYHRGEIPDGMLVDHINRDTLDNRIENLRLVNEKMSIHNRSLKLGTPIYGANGKFYYLDLSGEKKIKRWFKTWFEAVHARYAYELRYWGEPRKGTVDALLNLYV